jgi:hypothetical protein
MDNTTYRSKIKHLYFKNIGSTFLMIAILNISIVQDEHPNLQATLASSKKKQIEAFFVLFGIKY